MTAKSEGAWFPVLKGGPIVRISFEVVRHFRKRITCWVWCNIITHARRRHHRMARPVKEDDRKRGE